MTARKVGAVAGGTAYLCYLRRLRRSRQLGSRSGPTSAGIGGIDGHAVQVKGDRICTQLGKRDFRETEVSPLIMADGPIRVGVFWSAGRSLHWRGYRDLSEYCPSRQLRNRDRMGLRLAVRP